MPAQLQVVLNGIVAGGSDACLHCDLLDGTYVLNPFEGVPCIYYYEWPAICDGIDPSSVSYLQVDFDVFTNDAITVELVYWVNGAGPMHHYWTKDYATPPHCGLDGEELAFDSQPVGASCDSSTSTATLTAL